jgi:hypothetical protein
VDWLMRPLDVIDEFNREGFAIEVDLTLPARRMIRTILGMLMG